MMRALGHFGVHNPVVANLVVFSLIGAGLIFGVTLRREFFPEVRPSFVAIGIPYPGASPQEIEKSLIFKVEEALTDVEGIVEMQSTATENAGSILLEFKEGIDIEDAVAEVKRKIDALEDLPEQSERIVVEPREPNLPVIALAYVGPGDERSRKNVIREIRDDLRQLPGMGTIVLSGVRSDEISVQVRPAALLEHGLSIPAVTRVIGEAMAEVPGGSVRTETANISVRADGVEETADEVRSIVVKALPDGTTIRVEDIADVSYGFEDVDLITRFNGKPAVSLTVFKEGDEDAIQISEMVKAYAAGRTRQPLFPSGLESIQDVSAGDESARAPPRLQAYRLGLSQPSLGEEDLVANTDLARFIQGRLDLLRRNALYGGILVFMTLLLLLNVRVALWVTAGLIISILGTLAFMSLVGITLNLLTMFGLIIVIGLLVDDGIVVSENITARHEAGEPALEAAVNGMREVGWPVFATILTTVFAFSALLMVQGQIGDLLSVLPKVVMVALGVSLIEALFILPSHMGHSLLRHDTRDKRGIIGRLMDRFDDHRSRVFRNILVPRYLNFLRICLRHRYLSLCVAIALFIVSLGMVLGGRLPFAFLGEQDAETVVADLRMPVGTPLAETDRIISIIERAALRQQEVNYALSVIGARSNADGREAVSQSHVGQIWMELQAGEFRDRSSDQIIESIRELAGELPGIRSLRISGLQGGPEGPALTYTVTADRDQASLIEPVVEEIKALLATVEGVYDIADDADRGSLEVQFTLRPGARELGFTQENIATQIRGWVYGLEAHTFSVFDEDVDVRVLVDEQTRRSLRAVESLHLFTPDGRPVPLAEVVHIVEREANASVRGLDKRRAISVTAEVQDKARKTEKIAADLEPRLAAIERANPGVRILPRGQQKEVSESLSTIPLGVMLACGLIYVCLAWLFGSYTQPLIVLCAVPFAFIGMVWGHFLTGFNLTLLSLIGFIALTGVIVNDALIFIEFFNHKRREGIPLFESAVEAGRARFRAIILTTLTTVLGLLPLMAEQSFQARFLIPMALTISFGLISATFIVLLITPCLLLIGDDIRRFLRLLWTGRPMTPPPIPGDPFTPPGTGVDR